MFADLQKKVAHAVVENATSILTGVGVVGTVGTGILAGRGGIKAGKFIADEETKIVQDATDTRVLDDYGVKEKLRDTWVLFIPAVGAGSLTVVSVVLAHRVSAKQAAALATAYAISDRNFEDYKEKALEKLGKTKGQAVEDDLAQDRVNKEYKSEMIIVGDGDVLFMDLLTGRFFMSSVEKVSTALAKIHSSLYNNMYASFSEFCLELDLEPTEYTDNVGWNTSDIPEVRYSTSMTPDNRPCMTLSFSVPPKPGYADLY